MFSRSGYQALPLGDYNHFLQSSIGVYGSQKSLFSFGHVQDPWDQVPQVKGFSQHCLSWICHGIVTSLAFLMMVITFPISGWFVLKIIPAYERMTIFRLGRIAPQGPGMVLLLPLVVAIAVAMVLLLPSMDHWQLVDLRTRAFNVPPCSGRIGRGDPERNPDVILEMMENDLQAFFSGELHPLSAYMSRRLHVKGNLSVALKLEELSNVDRERECVCECARTCVHGVRRQEKQTV
ncbi:LOW QUALITY PROTEIN: stomatin-like protein 1 [Pangshura tecta]